MSAFKFHKKLKGILLLSNQKTFNKKSSKSSDSSHKKSSKSPDSSHSPSQFESGTSQVESLLGSVEIQMSTMNSIKDSFLIKSMKFLPVSLDMKSGELLVADHRITDLHHEQEFLYWLNILLKFAKIHVFSVDSLTLTLHVVWDPTDINKLDKTFFHSLLQLVHDHADGSLPKLVLDPNRRLASEWNSLQHPDFKLSLYPFQQKTVDWMLEREGCKIDQCGVIHKIPIPDLWEKIPVTDSVDFILSTAKFSTKDSPFTSFPNIERGGILSDQMGLGKTAMVLSLILLNPSTDPLVKTTLIIAPTAILQQWLNELQTHTNGLKTFTYIKAEHELLEGGLVDVEFLSQFDVVFTTYNFLKREIHASRPGRDGVRRGARSVQRREAAITQMNWYRVVLDEAQMVEGKYSRAFEMAVKLERKISWSVTGTPCPTTGKITDMPGLLEFVKSPAAYWLSTLKHLPESMLCEFLSPILHRNSKENVECVRSGALFNY